MKDKEVHGLMKLPPEAVIAQLRLELGKSNAYISELEEKLSDNGHNIKKQTLLCLEGRIKNLEKSLEKSRKECNKVVEHNLRMQKILFNL
jgi:biotin operon repressor